MEKIQEFSDKELIDELMSRFEHSIFGGIRTKIHHKDDIETKRSYNGNYATCAGIAFQIATFCTEDHFNNDK